MISSIAEGTFRSKNAANHLGIIGYLSDPKTFVGDGIKNSPLKLVRDFNALRVYGWQAVSDLAKHRKSNWFFRQWRKGVCWQSLLAFDGV